MVLGLESSRHFPSAVALKIAENADGTQSVPATFEVKQVPLGASRRFLRANYPPLAPHSFGVSGQTPGEGKVVRSRFLVVLWGVLWFRDHDERHCFWGGFTNCRVCPVFEMRAHQASRICGSGLTLFSDGVGNPGKHVCLPQRGER